jgi:hypothetical protein
VLVASDDGSLYCLSAASGELLWEFYGGPRRQSILGNGRMVSRWPARGGPVVADDRVYFFGRDLPHPRLLSVCAGSGQRRSGLGSTIRRASST